MKKCMIILSLIIFLFNKPSFAFENTDTHPKLSLFAVQSSELYKNLQETFGYLQGYNEVVSGKKIYEWIQKGAQEEDSPPCRAANHFHNPIAKDPSDPSRTSWAAGRLTDEFFLIEQYCDKENQKPNQDFSQKHSNLIWATGLTEDGPMVDPPPPNNDINTNNGRNWNVARLLLYTALVNGEAENRDEYLSLTFETLGYVLHLLEDMAVPAHTRNDIDGHVRVTSVSAINFKDFNKNKWVGNPFETYLYNKYKEVEEYFVGTPIKFAGTGETFKVSDFWDTDSYSWESPPSAGNNIGLSEYSNGNFVSPSTIFFYTDPSDSEHYFPYPNVGSIDLGTTPEEIFVPQVDFVSDTGVPHDVLYVPKEFDGEKMTRFLAARYFSDVLELDLYNLHYYLNDECYKEQAAKLVPRAIGYASGLIDYFFRGEIEVKPIRPENLAVSMIEGIGNRITGLKANLRNATMDQAQFPNEIMGAGSLLTVAKYTTDSGTEYSVSEEVPINDQNNNYVSHEIFTEYEFTFSDPIPLTATDTEIQIVFKGTLGNEQGSAVAVGRSGLFDTGIEITPPSEFVYSIIDGSGSQEFNKIKASVRDDLAGKQIQDGTLTAVAMYRNRINYDPNLTNFEPPSYFDSESDYTYSVSTPISISGIDSDPSTPDEYSFDFTIQPIPVGITDLYLYIVFEGTVLDGENVEPAAIVAGLNDLSEPDHRVFWNSTDQIVFSYYYENNNDELLDSLFYLDDFKNSPPDYWANLWCTFVDLNCNGITSEINSGNPELYVDPYDISYQLAFSGVDPQANQVNLEQVAEINNLPPGEHSRVIILTDRSNNEFVWQTEYLTRHYNVDPGPDSLESKYGTNYLYSYGVVNQLFDLTWSYTDLIPSDSLHRGAGQHRYSAEYICIAPLGNNCLYLGDERPVPAGLTPHPAVINF